MRGVLLLCVGATAYMAPQFPRARVTPLKMVEATRTEATDATAAEKARLQASRPPMISDARDMVDINALFEDESDESMVLDVEDGEASQSPLGYATDAFTSGVFRALHVVDDSGIVDSSKNLRVLWARALLHDAGDLEDPVAAELLPSLTRDVAKWDALKPLAKFAEFVTSRTKFIDGALDAFLDAAKPLNEAKVQVVVVGAGFDTRAMRYASRSKEERVQFY